MAASAYAALASLTHVLEQIQHPGRHQLRFDRSQIETLHDMVRFMLEFFEDHPAVAAYDAADEVDILRAMANCITEAEDVIDSHVVDQLSQRSADKDDMGYSSFYEDMERVIHKFKILKEEFAELREEKMSSQEQQPGVSLPAAAGTSAPPALSEKIKMVGFDDHLARIKDRLTGGESGLKIVPIVGMGGIGKTTLAQNIFHDPCFKNHFELHIWFTISQEYRVPDILVGLLGEVGGKESKGESIAELGQDLWKELFGRRYLIVLDDVWSTDVWDDLKLYFPDTSEGSRIIVTTRLSSISNSLGNENSYRVDLLDNEKSWKLLCKKVFGEEDCPDRELEEIGRRIASDCKGLPLAIVVIGGLLLKSNMTLERWEEVARNLNSIVNSEVDELCLNILSLSYNHLPIYLKSCFLHMRVYPEDYKVQVSQLIRSWIAEGFVISEGGTTLEEVAKEYLKELIDRNLILTNNQFGMILTNNQYGSWAKMIKSCGIHDLLRDLCFREYRKENTFHISKVFLGELMHDRGDYYRTREGNICHLCSDRVVSKGVHFKNRFKLKESSDANVLVCEICETTCPGRDTLRLVDIIRRKNHDFLPLPTKMRYLDVRNDRYDIFKPTWLPLFWNLQSLVFHSRRASEILLPEIWKMPQLRHVNTNRAVMPELPATPVDGKDLIILENLQTLGTVAKFRCSEEVLERIPNLKKLKIYGDERYRHLSYHKLHNLIHLSKLESLALQLNLPRIMKDYFPRSLKKLRLESCKFPWDEMTIIGSLPNLEVLKLERTSLTGKEWNPVEGQFLRLKSLSIHHTRDLFRWNAEKEHFPKFESLLLYSVDYLEKIPSGFGEIETLLSISLFHCSKDIVNSAKEIVAEQHTYGNDGLQLYVHDFEKHGNL